jgi:hypothetical protein
LDISGLSGGFVKKHKRLLLDAIVSYQVIIADEKAWPQAVRKDPDLMNLPRLKTRIESCDRVEENEVLIEGVMLKLLRTVVTDFRSRLGKLSEESKPWTDKRRIKAQLDELNNDEVREDLLGEQPLPHSYHLRTMK